MKKASDDSSPASGSAGVPFQRVDACLFPAQALAAATVGGAALLGKRDRLGRIAAGFEADLVILSANSLENVRHSRRVVAVFHDGNLLRDVVSLP